MHLFKREERVYPLKKAHQIGLAGANEQKGTVQTVFSCEQDISGHLKPYFNIQLKIYLYKNVFIIYLCVCLCVWSLVPSLKRLNGYFCREPKNFQLDCSKGRFLRHASLTKPKNESWKKSNRKMRHSFQCDV